MVSKFIKCIPLFVVFLIANFIFINNVSADQISCTYSGEVGQNDIKFSFTVGLDDSGNLFLKDLIYNEKLYDSTMVADKLYVDNKFVAADFSSNNEMVASCPDIYYTAIDKARYNNSSPSKSYSEITLIVGNSKESVDTDQVSGKEPIEDYGHYKVTVDKQILSTATVQKFNRGDKFYLDGKVVNEVAPKICNYKSSDGYTFSVQTANGRSWVNEHSFNPLKYPLNAVLVSNLGNIMGTDCVMNLYVVCADMVCNVNKDGSGDQFVYQDGLEEVGDAVLNGSFLGKIDGCEMLGSLGVLASELFKILQIISILLLIIFGMKDFAAAMMSGDSSAVSKAFQSFIKRIVVIVILFLLPVFINWILDQISLANNCIIEIAK